jgi:hypothetical protein
MGRSTSSRICGGLPPNAHVFVTTEVRLTFCGGKRVKRGGMRLKLDGVLAGVHVQGMVGALLKRPPPLTVQQSPGFVVAAACSVLQGTGEWPEPHPLQLPRQGPAQR